MNTPWVNARILHNFVIHKSNNSPRMQNTLTIVFITLSMLCMVTNSSAQEKPLSPNTIRQGTFLGISEPLKDLPVLTEDDWKAMQAKADAKRLNPKLELREYPFSGSASPKGPDAVWQKEHASGGSRAPLVNFEAQSSASYPPDCNGTAGPNHYMQTVNTTYAIYDKTGNILAGPTNMNLLFSGVPGSNCNSGDPLILYDEDADRWLAVEFSLCGATDMMLVAVSTTDDPTGTWYKYSFDVDDMPDYEKFGIWPDGYYMGVNNSSSDDIYVFERSVMLNGGTNPQMIGFNNAWRPSSVDGFMCVPPVDNDGTPAPAGSPGLFIAFNDDAIGGGSDELWIYELDADWTTPSNSTFTRTQQIAVSPFDSNFGNNWDNIKQPGTSQELDGIPQVIMNVPQYRNFGSYQTIVCCHTVDVDNTDHAGIRWYELRRTSGIWTVRQQGTYAPDIHSRWMGSIMLNGNNEIGLGYSISSTTVYPGIRYCGQSAENYQLANGILDYPEGVILEGANSQTGVNRWGDYALMSVDPVDDETFWFTTQYAGPGGSRKTRVASFQVGVPLPVVDFTASNTLPCLNSTITLEDQSSGNPFTWSWEISPASFIYVDGTDSTSQNPHIQFLAYGDYTVALTATNGGGSSTQTKTAYISVNAVNVDFVSNSTTVVNGYSVIITDLSSCGAGSYSWDFGEGASPATATNAGPHVVTYTTTGSKTITLTVNDSIVETKADYILVIDPLILMGNASISTCEGSFYDSGGFGSNYGNNQDYTLLLNPGIPGNNVKVEFSTFAIESGMFCSNDYLKIINGSSLNDPAIGVYCGTNNPGTVVASNPSGSLLFVFHSNSIISLPGWVATISCVEGVANPLSLEASPLNSSSIQLNWLPVGITDSVMLCWSPDGNFGNPQSGATYQAGQTIPGGGTVLYYGLDQSFLHDGLSPETVYHYKAYTKGSQGPWSSGITTSATTLPLQTLTVSPLLQTVTYQAGSASFEVTGNAVWTASTVADWCTVSGSGSGNGSITASYQENTHPIARTADIIVTASGENPVTLQLVQLPSFVGTADPSSAEILLYPNPTSGIFSISGLRGKDPSAVIQIKNQMGNFVNYLLSNEDGIYTFDISSEPAGLYLVSVTYGNESRSWKLMLK